LPIEKEIWKTIKEFPRYQVSNQGRIKSLIGNEKILKPTADNKGYLRVKLSHKPVGKGMYSAKTVRIHRLVAKYFCDNYAADKEIHHKNLRRQDNRAINLVCLTKAEHAELHRQLRQEQQERQKNAA